MSRSRDRRGGLAALALASLGVSLALAACELGGPQPARVIPGPTVPSPIPTRAPYVWDTRAELEIWTNSVTRGPVAVEGAGREAFIRIDPASAEWVLRGPDLEPPAAAVKTVRIRYRWTPASDLEPAAVRTGNLIAYFETLQLGPDQPTAGAEIFPTEGWTDVEFRPGSYTGALDVRYMYFRSFGWNRGVFEIDSIRIVQ